jgi:hypothetical protein
MFVLSILIDGDASMAMGARYESYKVSLHRPTDTRGGFAWVEKHAADRAFWSYGDVGICCGPAAEKA